MQVELHNVFQSLQVCEASQVVIRNIFGEPIAIILEPSPGAYLVKRWDDRDWPQALRTAGLPNTMHVDNLDAPKPPSIVLG